MRTLVACWSKTVETHHTTDPVQVPSAVGRTVVAVVRSERLLGQLRTWRVRLLCGVIRETLDIFKIASISRLILNITQNR